MAGITKCRHAPCTCTVAEENTYCSDHCKDAADQDIIEIKCDCGDASCS